MTVYKEEKVEKKVAAEVYIVQRTENWPDLNSTLEIRVFDTQAAVNDFIRAVKGFGNFTYICRTVLSQPICPTCGHSVSSAPSALVGEGVK